ncbi:YpdA family putative bacillithiol disulfide reductase [Mesonia sp. HuA40]|uniref:YpdA family putative bacillithiol disulfide reductase n=1 Tax=Mesonia sp. HuA40 TaxID=2602761 RepID=UPI0011CC558E|nr:YpdA family putative bacillithiol disulfide reductase [Mesonia sp. HuA40]TXK73681.1 YpdA family putative bacillithiol disulfide reductase [Mesonia sp. HuA40]
MILDCLIIGAGPIGLACGLEAQKNNLSYIILDKGALVNSLYHYPTNMTFFSTSEKLEIGGIPFISNNPKPTKQEALEYYRRITTANNLAVNLFEAVLEVKQSNESNLPTAYEIKTNKATYKAKNIIVATGFYDIPNKLNVPGEDLPKVNHYYNDPHYYAQQHVAIIGASNSAVDAALEIYRKGGKVSMIIRGEKIGERVKYWVRPDIENRIKEGSIKAYFNAEVTRILKDEIELRTPTSTIILPNDFILALTGYQPNFNFLKDLGIDWANKTKKIPFYDERTMETNQKGIYLAGVICGGLETHKWFIENSRIHATLITQDIVKKQD